MKLFGSYNKYVIRDVYGNNYGSFSSLKEANDYWSQFPKNTGKIKTAKLKKFNKRNKYGSKRLCNSRELF